MRGASAPVPSRMECPVSRRLAGARAAVAAMERLRGGTLEIYALQDLLGSK